MTCFILGLEVLVLLSIECRSLGLEYVSSRRRDMLPGTPIAQRPGQLFKRGTDHTGTAVTTLSWPAYIRWDFSPGAVNLVWEGRSPFSPKGTRQSQGEYKN